MSNHVGKSSAKRRRNAGGAASTATIAKNIENRAAFRPIPTITVKSINNIATCPNDTFKGRPTPPLPPQKIVLSLEVPPSYYCFLEPTKSLSKSPFTPLYFNMQVQFAETQPSVPRSSSTGSQASRKSIPTPQAPSQPSLVQSTNKLVNTLKISQTGLKKSKSVRVKNTLKNIASPIKTRKEEKAKKSDLEIREREEAARNVQDFLADGRLVLFLETDDTPT